ncbi:hypothetical protein MTYP_00775 [Methylophilaceae bacterium]|nr:hypothetical protein MTYP_00775 [Methylophilaceae bacterium]
MLSNKVPHGFHPISHDRPLIEQHIDAYRSKGKLADPTVCPQCSAVFHKGRWQWAETPADANHETCPACLRQQDNFPAGFVSLEGQFLIDHSDEIMRLVTNHEKHEKAEHPLKRIINIDRHEGAITITTTDIHLARGIGEAIHHAYQGHLELQYSPGENQLRAYWKR